MDMYAVIDYLIPPPLLSRPLHLAHVRLSAPDEMAAGRCGAVAPRPSLSLHQRPTDQNVCMPHRPEWIERVSL